MKRAAIGILIAAISIAPAAARAQGGKVAAEALFEEGRRLMAQKNVAQACPKFAESQRLDPSPSTLLNLGSCYERLGKNATAWSVYREAASAAASMNRQNLVSIAQRHAAALEPDLSRLMISAAAPVEGLEIRRDGSLVGHGAWGVAVPVDPGTVHIEASAPQKKKWTAQVEVTEPGKTVTVIVPALEDAPAEAEASAPPVSSPSQPAPASPVSIGPQRQADTAGGSGWPAQKTLGLVAGGVGIAGLAVGTVFVLQAKSKYDDSLAECPKDHNVCTAAGVALRDDSRRAGNIATVGYGVGIVALAAGVVLFLTAPKSERPSSAATLRISPSVGAVSGAFMDGQW